MTQKPAIIFDFGGVLLDWDPRNLYRKLFYGDLAAMENFLSEIDFHSWNLKQDAGRSFPEGVAELSARFPHYADLIRAYDERWEESIGDPIQGTVEMLQPLRESGFAIHGLSNWSAEKFKLVSHRYAFFGLFESILISGQVGLVKPNPLIFNLMLANIGRPAGDCIFIDDSPVNTDAAGRLGFRAILFESPGQLRAGLSRMGVDFQL